VDKLFNYEKVPRVPFPDLWKKAVKEVPKIDEAALTTCVVNATFSTRLNKNLQFGERVMGHKFGTPSLSINRNFVPGISFEQISEIIDNELAKP
jgi:hypothetical protein